MRPSSRRSCLSAAGWPCVLALVLSGCAVLGGAKKGGDMVMGGVDQAFHKAFYNAQVAKLKGDRAGAKEALLSLSLIHI